LTTGNAKLAGVARITATQSFFEGEEIEISLAKMISQIAVDTVITLPIGLLRSAAITLCTQGDRKFWFACPKKKI
jgi:hypothetical protein